MNRTHLATCMLFTFCLAASPVLGDGGFFYVEGEGTDLAQTRQEVLLAIHGSAGDAAGYVTYVLRSRYTGEPAALAWVVPVPATPANVVSHESGRLFEQLNELTEPRFMAYSRTSGGLGCAGGGLAADGESLGDGLVEVEAAGQAGIFNWAALTSTGSDALLSWLNTNGYALPSEAGDVLNGYIQQEMHFLAIRVNEPDQIETGDDGEVEIPPIQWTCQTSNRFYPMAISRISADSETEVLIYVLADHRAEAANVSNGLIDSASVIYDAGSASLTNYESLFTQKITELGGTGLITECVLPYWYTYYRSFTDWRSELTWPDAPAGVLDLEFLTRMRTVIARENMTLDFEFQDASDDETVLSDFYVTVPSSTTTTPLVVQLLAALLGFSLLRIVTLRRAG